MVQSKKFRGVRQRHWGSWVSEIRHPLLKRRVWLGTFETAEEAARVYDEAAVLMSGRNAKTNFPVPRNPAGDVQLQGRCQGGGSHHVSPTGLSEILSAKLRKCCKTPSPSLTCLRLDTEKSHLGVWQKRAGARADSSWVMRVELAMSSQPAVPPSSAGEGTSSTTSTSQKASGGTEEEERLALQMIEELLSRNCGPASSPCRAGTAPDGDGCSSSSSTSSSSSI